MKQESHSSSSSSSSSSPTVISPVPVSNSVDDRSGQPDETQANEIPKTNKKETTIERGNPLCSDDPEIPEWLQEFRENLVDDEIPLQGGSHASSSHEASLEPTTKRREDLGKHNVHTHFPKDRNCEICKRTKITRAPCRRRKGEAVPRADNFGDLITADHKVLSDICESRNNHRYAVVVQDLATQWIQAYPCKNKTSQETQRSLQKFLESERKPKVIYTDNSLEFGKACEDLSWNHCTSTPHRSESMRKIATTTVANFSNYKMKGEKCSSRLVCREIKKTKDRDEQLGPENVFSPMPPSEGLKMLVSTMMTGHDDGNHADGPFEMATWDVSRAHFYGEARRWIYMYLPEGHEQVVKLARSMYGTRDAASIWETHGQMC